MIPVFISTDQETKYFPSMEYKQGNTGINIFGSNSHFTKQWSDADRLTYTKYYHCHILLSRVE